MNILYLMHIPWGWIKQRPHFFAELLDQDFTVTVFFKRPWKVKRDHIYTNEKCSFRISSFIVLPFERIPFLRKMTFLGWINFCLIRLQLRNIGRYDYIWVTSIMMYYYIYPFIKKQHVLIYDCMDDELEFPSIKRNSVLMGKIKKYEKRLLDRANIIFCSATYLQRKIEQRSCCDEKKFTILNNGIQIPAQNEVRNIPESVQVKLDEIKDMPNVLMYVGTIAEWFDFELVLSMLEKNPSVHIVLLGPNDVNIPIHRRIYHAGAIERKYVFCFLELADCLFMPFKVNELIRSVNPVKLYEYIYMNKVVIAPLYEETLQFEPYIYLYSNPDEFNHLCSAIINKTIGCKSTPILNADFVRDNVWEQRYQIIKSKLLQR